MSTELFTTSTAAPLIEIAGLDVTYRDGLRAVEGVSFSLRAGEFVAMVGPSGCGKSTLLRSIAGLIRPSRGRLTVAGLEPERARRESTRMSFVFQDPTLLPWRDVYHNIALPLELADDHRGRARRDRDARVRQAIELVGLADFAGSYPAGLSGGMRMRVSLARAVVTDPALLLLDEPFAALDDITRQSLNEELLALWTSRHWTGLFVTHNIAEAIFLSQRVLVLSRRPGRIVADVAVPFPFPRAGTLRAQADFARLTGEVAAHLVEASR
ncbi:MAG TPA: ABC transporter ATP-binding protein [Pirellulales bacterium]|jgi:NitT/TauT family transport system ATP-binding protein|nr:ABC transporter ATP-binding protein [Pirellulales bacterium]